MKRIKEWLYKHFLPRVTMESYLKDMANLRYKLKEAEQENKELKAYISGMERALRSRTKIEINNGDKK